MPDTATPDPAAAELAAIRERLKVNLNMGWTRKTEDLPRLLAAVEAVLALHNPGGFTETTEACATHEYRSRSRVTTDIAERGACPRCRVTQRVHCWQAGCGDEWPCPTYRAITAELTGKDGT